MDTNPADRAAHDDLRYIRRTLDAAGRFSSVSGKGFALIGLFALAAAVLNLRWTGAPWDPRAQMDWALGVWAVLLAVSIFVGVWMTARKARRTGQVLWSPVLRRALWGYGAAMLVGGVLTLAVLRAGYLDLLAEIWLGCYGAALVSAGILSVSPVRWMGIAFIGLALAAAVLPPSFDLLLVSLGFGWLHVGFGAYIAWRHDG